jgi:hypothetical protein
MLQWRVTQEPTTFARGGIISFHTLVGSSHPSTWTVIKWFQREQSTVTTIVQQDSVGTQPAKRVSQKLMLLQKRIQNLCHDRVSGRKIVPEFLHGIACNIRLSRHTTAPAKETNEHLKSAEMTV